MYAMSAAHTILPIPSYARVTNLANGKSVVVRINDRGPFHADRIIDLSYAAAYKLGYVNAGQRQVEVEAILPGKRAAAGEHPPVYRKARCRAYSPPSWSPALARRARGAGSRPPGARAWLLLDATSGQLLASRNPDERVEPRRSPSS